MNIEEIIKKEIQTQVLVGTGSDIIYPDPNAKTGDNGETIAFQIKQKYIEAIDIDKLVDILIKIMKKANVQISDIIDL